MTPAPDWTAARLADIVEHIQRRYHRRLRDDLPRLDAVFRREAAAAALGTLHATYTGFMAELLDHMDKEDGVLFPAIVDAERASGSGGAQAWGWVEHPIAIMLAEHASAEAALDTMRRLTGGFVAPAEAPAAIGDLYAELAVIDADLQEHIHLENDILFPRAAALVA